MRDEPETDPKQPLFDQFSVVAKAFAHGHRLALLEVLAQAERDVNSLARGTHLSIANTSQHLKVLRTAGLVSRRRSGKHVVYALADDTVVGLVRSLRVFAEQHSGPARKTVRDYWPQMDRSPEVSRQTLMGWIEAGAVVLFDTRPAEEFRAAHIPGARHLAKGAAKTLDAADIDRRHVVAYCRGAYCAALHETLERLRALGATAHRLEDGFAEWRAAGLPVRCQEI